MPHVRRLEQGREGTPKDIAGSGGILGLVVAIWLQFWKRQ